jgi:hypothetical protein
MQTIAALVTGPTSLSASISLLLRVTSREPDPTRSRDRVVSSVECPGQAMTARGQDGGGGSLRDRGESRADLHIGMVAHEWTRPVDTALSQANDEGWTCP